MAWSSDHTSSAHSYIAPTRGYFRSFGSKPMPSVTNVLVVDGSYSCGPKPTKFAILLSGADQMYSRLDRLMLALIVGLFRLTAHAQEKPSPESQVSTVLLRTDHSWDGVKCGPYPAGQPELALLKINIPTPSAFESRRSGGCLVDDCDVSSVFISYVDHFVILNPP
jgi:hypothetical protein